MIIDTNYGLAKIARKLKSREAAIEGVCRHEMCDYWVVDDYEDQTTNHVLCATRPTWERYQKELNEKKQQKKAEKKPKNLKSLVTKYRKK